MDLDGDLCRYLNLVPAWLIGDRTIETASVFMEDLASRFSHRVQLTTDGHKAYLEAVDGAFGADIDYAMLIKIYGESVEQKVEKRYSPAKYTGSKVEVVAGNPDRKHISTSYAERQNLTMRMSMRRFTRLTNGFSKKVENLAHAVSLHFMYYNFGRIHKTLRVTPAMEAGISDHVWSLEEIAGLWRTMLTTIMPLTKKYYLDKKIPMLTINPYLNRIVVEVRVRPEPAVC